MTPKRFLCFFTTTSSNCFFSAGLGSSSCRVKKRRSFSKCRLFIGKWSTLRIALASNRSGGTTISGRKLRNRMEKSSVFQA